MELKSCPFCGAPGKLIDTGSWGTFYGACTECSAEGPYFENKEKAIEAWNTRTGEK